MQTLAKKREKLNTRHKGIHQKLHKNAKKQKIEYGNEKIKIATEVNNPTEFAEKHTNEILETLTSRRLQLRSDSQNETNKQTTRDNESNNVIK